MTSNPGDERSIPLVSCDASIASSRVTVSCLMSRSTHEPTKDPAQPQNLSPNPPSNPSQQIPPSPRPLVFHKSRVRHLIHPKLTSGKHLNHPPYNLRQITSQIPRKTPKSLTKPETTSPNQPITPPLISNSTNPTQQVLRTFLCASPDCHMTKLHLCYSSTNLVVKVKTFCCFTSSISALQEADTMLSLSRVSQL